MRLNGLDAVRANVPGLNKRGGLWTARLTAHVCLPSPQSCLSIVAHPVASHGHHHVTRTDRVSDYVKTRKVRAGLVLQGARTLHLSQGHV